MVQTDNYKKQQVQSTLKKVSQIIIIKCYQIYYQTEITNDPKMTNITLQYIETLLTTLRKHYYNHVKNTSTKTKA